MNTVAATRSLASAHPVTVHVPDSMTLDQVNKVTAEVLGKLGCGHCYSGYDIRFVGIREFVVHPKSFEVNEFGR
jgi:hypothetical protein